LPESRTITEESSAGVRGAAFLVRGVTALPPIVAATTGRFRATWRRGNFGFCDTFFLC
jgi:hypothetical protein